MSTFPVLARLERLLQQLRKLRLGHYSLAGQHRLRFVLTATIEALHDLYASPLRYHDFFRHQLVLNQMLLVQQAIFLAPSIDASLLVSGPSVTRWQQTHELLLHVLEITLVTPPLC